MEIHIRNLTFAWPHSDFRLEIPHLKVEAARSLAIVGPSGSGKSTFLNLLAGMLPSRSGSLQIGAHSLTGMSDHQRRTFRQNNIGFVFQDFKLVEYLNVTDNILTPWRLKESNALPAEAMYDRLSHLTTELGLTPFIHRPIQRLSQGEKQRVAIARALCLKPGLILADEPTGNLDPSNKIRVRDLLQQEALNLNATLVMVTHDRELVTPFDQVIDFETFQPRQPQTAQTS